MLFDREMEQCSWGPWSSHLNSLYWGPKMMYGHSAQALTPAKTRLRCATGGIRAWIYCPSKLAGISCFRHLWFERTEKPASEDRLKGFWVGSDEVYTADVYMRFVSLFRVLCMALIKKNMLTLTWRNREHLADRWCLWYHYINRTLKAKVAFHISLIKSVRSLYQGFMYRHRV